VKPDPSTRFQDRLESAPLLDGEARREADVIEVPILVVQPDQERADLTAGLSVPEALGGVDALEEIVEVGAGAPFAPRGRRAEQSPPDAVTRRGQSYASGEKQDDQDQHDEPEAP
jgi:hypothetical protein